MNKIFLKKNVLHFLSDLQLSNPVSFNVQDYEKQKGSETTDQLLFRLQNKFRKIPLLEIFPY